VNKILTQSEIEEMLIDVGLKKRRQARIGAAIALCEAPAGISPNGEFQANFSAVGDQELADEIWGFSYGGFQIRSLRSQKGTGGLRDEEKLLTPRFNCKSAVKIKRSWGSWKAWSTYTSGMYKAYLQDLFPPPVGTYVVVAGDTLNTITQKLSDGSWDWKALARHNNIHYPYMIFVGEHILLP